jgi:hypothetical protein
VAGERGTVLRHGGNRMRSSTALLSLLLLAGLARADCPPDCFPGGGPAATDCFIEWRGISAGSTTCRDGEACDMDGQLDGVCTFPLQACINVDGSASGCQATGLTGAPKVTPRKGPGAALASAIAALDPAGPSCTPAGLAVPLKVSVAGIKKVKARMKVTVKSGRKKDTDTITLVCEAGTPPLAGAVQDAFTAKCAIPTCHEGSVPSGDLSLEDGSTTAGTVNVRAVANRKLVRIKPGSVRKSFLARKLFRNGIPANGSQGALMPSGCNSAAPEKCLTDAELLAILSWIQAGAN